MTAAVETRSSFCRNCGAQCGIALKISDNRIVSLRGDKDNPLSRGYFCVKGEASAERQNGAGRLLTALARDDAAQHVIATEAAIDRVAARLDDLLRRWGPRSIGIYYGTPAYSATLAIPTAKAFLKAMGSPHLYSSQTIDQSPKTVAALRMGAFKSGRQPFATSDVWLISGANPLVSHLGGWGGQTMYAPAADIRAAKARGLRLIVIDPRRTETSRLADIHLQPHPGQDVALYAGMIHILFAEGLIDQAFCARYATQLDALRSAVAPYTPAFAAAEAGVPEDLLIEAARVFGSAKRGCATSGTGPDMAPHANLAAHLLEAMNVLCGRYRRVGEPVINPSILSAAPVKEGVWAPYPVWNHSPKMASHPDIGWAIPGEYPTTLLPDEILHDGDERLRALIVVGGNPLAAIPDGRHAEAAFAKLELLVTLDIQQTATSAVSDIVIACKSPYERADLGTMSDANSPVAGVQYSRPALDAPAAAIEEWQFILALAARMGLDLDWEFSNFGSPTSGDVMKIAAGDMPSAEDFFTFICRCEGASFAEIAASGAVGQILDLPPESVQPAAVDDGARIDLLPAEVAEELRSCLASRQKREGPPDALLLHCRRLLEVMNSNYIDSAAAIRRLPENPLYMHPDDMAARGLTAGDRVEVRSSHGVLSAPVRSDPTERPGAVSMHHGWKGADGKTVAELIDHVAPRERHNHVPRMTAIPVIVARANPSGADA